LRRGSSTLHVLPSAVIEGASLLLPVHKKRLHAKAIYTSWPMLASEKTFVDMLPTHAIFSFHHQYSPIRHFCISKLCYRVPDITLCLCHAMLCMLSLWTGSILLLCFTLLIIPPIQ